MAKLGPVRFLGVLAGLASALAVAAPAAADEPHGVAEPILFSEPAEITQVADAVDGDDPFDLLLTAGLVQTWKTAQIRRETSITQDGLSSGGFTSRALNVAEYTESTSRLNTRADIGLYKDLALVLRLPIILSNDRELVGVKGSGAAQATTLAGAPGEQLFSLPFKSPTRSGVEYLAVGLDVGILNQARDYTKPTWIFGAEGRFDVAEPMHACKESTEGLNLGSQQQKCANPSDVNRNGVADKPAVAGAVPIEGVFNGGRAPGVSRGTTGLEVHTYLSKRVKYIEPYGGFTALFEFANDSSEYGASRDLKGVLVNHPPLQGSMIVGINVIPWEARGEFQRLTFDFRSTGTYVSEGRDYTELFDALGSSDAPSLRNPNFAGYKANPAFPGTSPDPSIIDPASTKVYSEGLSDTQQYAEMKLTSQFTWQPGQYVKFNLGGGLKLTQSHLITYDQACATGQSNTVAEAGPCRSQSGGAFTASGVPNPHFRRVIDDPGSRFLVDGSHSFDAWLNVVLML